MYIQNIGFSGSQLLDEVLVNSAENAILGGGAYAFVSAGGLQIYLEDDKFKSFIADNEFTLIVGIDEITNIRTLTKLTELENHYANLTVKVFYKLRGNEIFHVKFSWFQYQDGSGKLIIGSGNLTIKGLRKNVEAFTVEDLSVERMTEVKLYWDSWLTESIEYLKNLDDEIIIAKAIENQNRFRTQRRTTDEVVPIVDEVQTNAVMEDEVFPVVDEVQTNQIIGDEVVPIVDEVQTNPIIEDDIDDDVWNFDNTNCALIAEIPGSGDRWKQANFSKEVFENFFGIIPNEVGDLRILLRNVNDAGVLQDIESRPGVSVSSDNHRFELNAGSGIPYPANGAPVGIFIRVALRTFIYCLVFPDDANYNNLILFLNANYSGRSNSKKRVMVNCHQIEDIILESPLENLRD